MAMHVVPMRKWANLHFRTGASLQISIDDEMWPQTIVHQATVFDYAGVQYGIGAYTERVEKVVSA